MDGIRKTIKNFPLIGPLAVWAGKEKMLVEKRLRQRRWFRESRNILAKNSELKGEMAGKRCFILSAGPSLKDQDLSGLENEFCISISNVFVHPAFAKIKPRYHLFPASHTPITDEQYIAWFQDAEKHFPDGQRVLVATRDKYLVDRTNLFKRQRVYYYISDEFSLSRFNKEIDFTDLLPIIQTTVQWAIYLAIYLGAKEIYLLGCDHNWYMGGVEYDKTTGKSHSKHFYDYKNYVLAQKGYDDKSGVDMETQFKAYLQLWKIYRYIKRYADSHEISIVNATPGSLLDIFPRADLREVLVQNKNQNHNIH